jgi:Ca-activated chloride channel family protein
MMRAVRSLLWIGLALPLAAVAAAAPQVVVLPQPPLFRSQVSLTTVTATVLDRNGALVTGLAREAFDVYEDGNLQPIAQFTNERVPVSLAVLLDVSDSMFGQRLKDARDAITRFVTDLLARGDEYAIVAFNHRQHVLTAWTSDASLATPAMAMLRPFGSTAIYDAIVAALPLADVRSRQRAALLVISDGADTASDMTLRDARSALLRSDAFVYAVGVDSANRRPINAAVNSAALAELTDQSGGRTKVVGTSADLSAALNEIAEELNSQYLIGYTSPKPDDGEYHTIRVRIRGADYRVRARNGYVARPKTGVRN